MRIPKARLELLKLSRTRTKVRSIWLATFTMLTLALTLGAATVYAAQGQNVYPYWNECSTVGRGYAVAQDGYDHIMASHLDDLGCAVSVGARAWYYEAGYGWQYGPWAYDGYYAETWQIRFDFLYGKAEVKLLVGSWSPSVWTGNLSP